MSKVSTPALEEILRETDEWSWGDDDGDMHLVADNAKRLIRAAYEAGKRDAEIQREIEDFGKLPEWAQRLRPIE
jgi:hypothetical protein